MNFSKSKKYAQSFINENMMGPNSMKMLEELLQSVKIEKGMRILDLGCGKGLTSVFLAKEFGAQVFATDLWIGATENYELIKSLNLENQIIPIHANAMDLPYADEYFDMIVSIDSYYYFGTEPDFMDAKIAQLIKKGGTIAIAFPGVKNELNGMLPDEMLPSWAEVKDEVFKTFHSIQWWKDLLSKSKEIEIESIQEMGCFEECWQDWLSCEHQYAINDRLSMEAGAGKYMNLIAIIAKRN